MKIKIIALIYFLVFSSFFLAFPVFANNNANTNNSIFSVSTNSVPSDGSSTATISVGVRDDSNNAVVGDTVVLTSTSDSGLVINGGNIGIDSATATTDSNGNVSFTINSNNPNPGVDTFTASDTSDNPSIPLGSNTSVAVTFTQPSSCNYNAPGTPQISSAVANGNNQITVTWQDVANPASYYLVSYGLSSGQYIYGNPNVGGQGTTSYVVGNLARGTTYYFVVKAVNGCTPGNFSNEVSATTTGGAVTLTPTPTPDTSLNSSSQNNTIPTDTPTPTENAQPTLTPLPIQIVNSSDSKIKILEYIILCVLIFGSVAVFISWKYNKGLKKTENNIVDKENQPEKEQENKLI